MGYETFRADRELLVQRRWDLLVLDDASKFKSPESGLTLAAWHVATQCDRGWAASATPIETSLLDMWSIFHAINSHPWGTYEEFSVRYLVWGPKGVRGEKQVAGYQNLEDFKEKLRPYILRRENPHAPRIHILTHRMGMYPEQIRLYNLARNGHFGNTIYDKFTRAIMTCDSSSFFENPGVSSKADVFEMMVDRYPGKIVVYSQWKEMIYLLKIRLGRRRIKYVEISGDVPLALRSIYQKNFREDPDVRVCFVTKAAEQALNLQSAQIMVTINRIANPQRMKQIYGRIARRGSPFSEIYIIEMVIEGSIEERMLELLRRRAQLFQDVMEDQIQPIRLSTDDMNLLLMQTENITPRVVNSPEEAIESGTSEEAES
jgi:SNF2 family DNA or RNA helicase